MSKVKQVCRFKVLRVYSKSLGRDPFYLGQWNKMESCIDAAMLQMSREKNYKEARKGVDPAEYVDFTVFEYNLNDIDGYYQEPCLVNYCTLDKIIEIQASSVVDVIGTMGSQVIKPKNIIN